jgi:hypothetical protein
MQLHCLPIALQNKFTTAFHKEFEVFDILVWRPKKILMKLATHCAVMISAFSGLFGFSLQFYFIFVYF